MTVNHRNVAGSFQDLDSDIILNIGGLVLIGLLKNVTKEKHLQEILVR